ncbi:N-acetyltransferase [Sphingobacterium psychroaquaticum]|uniref:GNAT family N-acetyltransferase n=1 Tax=Sphingobacterium psychroaquaticum TaxID=561061 RepID=UPI00106D963D|nr:N-acetyltransferase [Sphingobacterium psychroaquaticum]QBQ42675.1 N-acetyltransferase [Sphingobacterium psychroaquaticum]
MEIINNTEKLQFEYTKGGEVAKLEYRFYKQKNIALVHTLVPDSMRGEGVASALAAAAFAYAKEVDKKVMVYCPFVAAYVKKNPVVREQIDRAYHPGL